MQNDITIGMDLGNKVHKVVGLDAHGNEFLRCEVENTKDAIEMFFGQHPNATVAMETGTCCRWISAIARRSCRGVLVGNARKLRAIWQSKQKNDWNDALMIASLARASKGLFHPVALRDDEHHDLYQLVQLRDIVVRQRTQVINSIRGMCKASGVSCANAMRKASTGISNTFRNRRPGSSVPCWKGSAQFPKASRNTTGR